MALTSVTGYTPQTLIKNMRTIGGGKNFLTDFLGGGGRMHSTEAITLAETAGTVRLLPAIGHDAMATPMAMPGSTILSIVPPRIRVSVALNEDVASQPMYGDDSYAGSQTDLNAGLRARVAYEQRLIKESLAMTIENHFAALISTGTATFLDVDGTARYTISFSFTGNGVTAGDSLNIQPALTGTAAWDKGSARILYLLNTWERQIRAYSDYGGRLAVIIGYDVEDAILHDTKLASLLDNRRMVMGQLHPAGENNYVGSIGRFDLYSYTRSIRGSVGSTVTDLWNPKTVAMVPVEGSAISLHYGAVFENLSGAPGGRCGWITTDYYSKIYASDDPPSDILIVESRPAPLLEDIRPIRICRVIV